MKTNLRRIISGLPGIVLLTCIVFPIASSAQSNREWGTYYGGMNEDWGKSAATDSSGNVYLAGLTSSTSGIASGGFQNVYGGGTYDAFLVKLDSSGNRLWATYYGGSNDDRGVSVTVDKSGNVYLSGTTISTNAIASGGFQNTFGGVKDGFLVKFDGAGNRIWSTYYGGTGDEEGGFVVTDTSGNVFLAGYSDSYTGIASNGFQNTYNTGYDGYVVKFDASGSRLWGTYYGGAGFDYGLSVTTDLSGNVFLTGYTASTTNISSGGFQNSLIGGNTNAFLVKFNATGSRLWATYYGAYGEQGWDVATDLSGNVYLTGNTGATSGIASGGFQNVYGGGPYDAFLVKFDALGNRLWATYYGGSYQDVGYAVATDHSGNVFLSGITKSINGISSIGFQSTSGGGPFDAFLVVFTAAGNRLCGTYYGGAGNEDDLNTIAVDNFNNVYLAGYTDTTTTTAIASGGFQNIYSGGIHDAFLVKFSSAGVFSQTEELAPNENLAVFPNPSAGHFVIENKNVENGTLKIFDMKGQLIYAFGNFNRKKEVDLSTAVNGVYFVVIEGGKESYSRKIIVNQ
ncbi:hypothetical protein BH11BAC7_BH11BAC7_22810 [soil metagenome]